MESKKVEGLILDKGEEYYTYMSKIFTAIGGVQKDYNWFITDCECYPKTEKFQHLLSREYCWLSGNELTKIVETENFQWIWAVLSGFEKNISLEEVLTYPLPYADGYEGFWHNPLTIQHPLASVEIVPFDSSLTLILSNERTIISDFKRVFPLNEDLVTYNMKRYKWNGGQE